MSKLTLPLGYKQDYFTTTDGRRIPVLISPGLDILTGLPIVEAVNAEDAAEVAKLMEGVQAAKIAKDKITNRDIQITSTVKRKTKQGISGDVQLATVNDARAKRKRRMERNKKLVQVGGLERVN